MGGRVSIVFGPEASGLRNDELDLCQARVHIPTAADHSSLNLAQAVLILGYEVFLAASRDEPRPQPNRERPPARSKAALDDLRRGAPRESAS